MIDAGVLDAPVFAFYLGTLKDSTDPVMHELFEGGGKGAVVCMLTGVCGGAAVMVKVGYDGELTLGGVDAKYYSGDLSWVALQSADYWRVEMASVTVGGSEVTDPTQRVAIVDSGTSLLVGPLAVVADIAQALNATANLAGEWFVDCGAPLPALVVTLGGVAYVLEGSDLVLESGGQCLLLLMGLDLTGTGVDWILGDVFMRKYYSVFDYANQKVGFALANHSQVA
jgi:hypothetical protein